MYRQLTEQAEKYLRSLYQQDDIAGQLKRRLANLMARGEANADAACRALKLSRRTLQRRLKAEKTSFQKILTEVRAELAINYLRDARLKSLEIAMLLGYSNISSFTTAFKSWYDIPPAEYRQKFLARHSSPGTTYRRPSTGKNSSPFADFASRQDATARSHSSVI